MTAARTGFVAVLGRPNVGKSTLVNALLGQKIAIVTPKPQTTRRRLMAVLNEPEGQLILVDTPGLCGQRTALGRAMGRMVGRAAADADVALVVAEVSRKGSPEVRPEDRAVLKAANRAQGKIFVALNKVDTLSDKSLVLPWIDAFARASDAEAIIPISARKGDGLAPLLAALMAALPEGEPVFPPDMLTDQAERFICGELVREQLLLQLQQEVPHSVAVEIEHFEDGRSSDGTGLCRLTGRIYVERESQKGIVVGKRGARIKSVSTAARREMEDLLGCKVYLRLVVRVDPDWTRKQGAVTRRGFGA